MQEQRVDGTVGPVQALLMAEQEKALRELFNESLDDPEVDHVDVFKHTQREERQERFNKQPPHIRERIMSAKRFETRRR